MLPVQQTPYAQELFNRGAAVATDKAVRKAVIDTIEALKPTATNTPDGGALDPSGTTVPSPKVNNVLSAIGKLYANQPAGSISVTICGESHDNASDKDRARRVIGQIAAGALLPTLVAFERGMDYPTTGISCPIARETNMTTVEAGDFGVKQGLSPAQRSMIVAGYIFLCVAGGPQNGVDKVLVFFGEEHKDIFEHFEYFTRHSTCDWVAKRHRDLVLIRSSV